MRGCRGYRGERGGWCLERRYGKLGALVFVAVVLASPRALDAQAMGGRVVDDATDAPIPGVTLTLLNVAGEAVASGLTGADGAFHIDAPRSGYFRLRGDRIGYATTDSELVALLAADTTMVEFRLPEAPVALPALRVSTTRHEIFEPLAQWGYYDRRELYQEKMGTALFLDSDQIEKPERTVEVE